MIRLTEWIGDKEKAIPRMDFKNNGHDKCMRKLAHLEDLEDQGRLIKLPCAVGDVVYTNLSSTGWYLRKKNRPYAVKIVFIGINGMDNLMNVAYENGNMTQFLFSEIGKTVFLTREAAEAMVEK